MKENQFIWWLKGYLENETYVGSEGVNLIKKKLDQVDEEVETKTDKQSISYLPGTSGVITIPSSGTSYPVSTTLDYTAKVNDTNNTSNKQILND
jgi:hypothetical protein